MESEFPSESNPDETSKPCTSETQGSELTGEWNPDETTKPRTSDTGESELTGEWHPKETTKPCTSDTGETELSGEWNPEETTNLIKSVNHTHLTHGKVNSLVNETLMKQSTVHLWNMWKCTQLKKTVK